MRAFQINRPPAKLNLLTCQVRPNPEDKKTFDLVTSRFISNVWPMTLFPLHNIIQVSSGVQMYVFLPTVQAFTPDWVNCSLKLHQLHFTALSFAPPQIIGHTISRQRMSRNAWCKCWNCYSHHSLPYLLLSCSFLCMLLHILPLYFGVKRCKKEFTYTMAAVLLLWRKAEDVLQAPPLTSWCWVELFLVTDSQQQSLIVFCGDWGK